MSRAWGRFLFLVILIAAASAAGLFAVDRRARLDHLLAAHDGINAALDRLVAYTIEINSAQQAYIVPGERDAVMRRSEAALARLGASHRALSAGAHPEPVRRSLKAIADASEGLSQVDERARQNLQVGQELMAADLIANEAGPLASSIVQEVGRAREAELSAMARERDALFAQLWRALAGTALLWMLGLAGLVKSRVGTAAPVEAMSAPLPPADPRPAPALDLSSSADLMGAATVCADISRLGNSEQLPGILSRVCALLDARGVVVWMSAGEELFAALSHGYDPTVISQLGRIGRSHDNATTAAWRSGQLQTVSGHRGSNGAIAVPMCAGDRCIGVLALEVRDGLEHEPSRQALATIIAAQLASVVIAWPAPSTVEPRPTDSLSSVAS